MRNKETDNTLKYLSTPCTITEAAQIARGVAEDVLSDYTKSIGHVQVAMSIQLEMLKDIMISKGLVTEEEFRALYAEQVKEFNEIQQEMIKERSEATRVDTDMSGKVHDIEIKKY